MDSTRGRPSRLRNIYALESRIAAEYRAVGMSFEPDLLSIDELVDSVSPQMSRRQIMQMLKDRRIPATKVRGRLFVSHVAECALQKYAGTWGKNHAAAELLETIREKESLLVRLQSRRHEIPRWRALGMPDDEAEKEIAILLRLEASLEQFIAATYSTIRATQTRADFESEHSDLFEPDTTFDQELGPYRERV